MDRGGAHEHTAVAIWIHVDFQNCDSDGHVRVNNVGAIRCIAERGLVSRDGVPVVLTDGEATVPGIVRSPGKAGLWQAECDYEEVVRSYGAYDPGT